MRDEPVDIKIKLKVHMLVIFWFVLGLFRLEWLELVHIAFRKFFGSLTRELSKLTIPNTTYLFRNAGIGSKSPIMAVVFFKVEVFNRHTKPSESSRGAFKLKRSKTNG